jgi:diadenylate cyclase
MNLPIPLDWKDFVDIFVISFILHRIFLLMRGTAVVQITIGLVSLWLFQELARVSGLVLTSWFFRGIGAIFVLVIVVVFHAEIREILVQTNPVRFLLGRARQTRPLGYHLIGQAVFRLARRRTGALIVIQNLDELGSNAGGGFVLDGNLIPEVLEGLFAKDSPVHDGAAVIRGNRIARVGTFLPLSQSEGLPNHFGTRHRAAVGLSETCDAVILVVSEERGEISLVHRRNVQLIRNPDQLESTLSQLILSDRKLGGDPKRWSRVWLSQVGGLVLTFLLVSVFWGVYAGGRFSMLPLRVPVQFRNIPAGMQLTDSSAQEVEVQVSGKRGLVSSLDPQQVKAFLNLDGISAGEHERALKSDNILLPPGLDVEQITPSSITFHMKRFLERTVEVKPDLVGPCPEGTKVVDVRVKPASLKVRGPVESLKDLTDIRTVPILLRNLQIQGGRAVTDSALDLSPSLQLLELPRARVEVLIEFGSEGLRAEEQGTRNYLVRKGDTLFLIGRRYGVSVEALLRANNLDPESPIRPGQALRIPGS